MWASSPTKRNDHHNNPPLQGEVSAKLTEGESFPKENNDGTNHNRTATNLRRKAPTVQPNNRNASTNDPPNPTVQNTSGFRSRLRSGDVFRGSNASYTDVCERFGARKNRPISDASGSRPTLQTCVAPTQYKTRRRKITAEVPTTDGAENPTAKHNIKTGKSFSDAPPRR